MITPREEFLINLARMAVATARDPGSNGGTLELVERELDALVAADDMPAGWNRPAPATTSDVTHCLIDAATRVGAGDSWEGTITWAIPMGEPELEGADFGMIARYRVGNIDGQGGLRVFTPSDVDA